MNDVKEREDVKIPFWTNFKLIDLRRAREFEPRSENISPRVMLFGVTDSFLLGMFHR